jgi:beta-mannanase
LFQNEDLEDENEVEVFHEAKEELDEANTFFDGDAYADVVKHKAVK